LLHNFIDGAAIGIAFNLGNPNEFIPVTIGIIAHEIPREMGDVAILLKSKFNAKETIISNGVVNLISLVGVWLGLNAHVIPDVTKQYILVFVAGNFLYIASDIWKHLFNNKRFYVNLLEMLGLICGVMLTMADHSHGHGHGHSHGHHDHSHHDHSHHNPSHHGHHHHNHPHHH
jgi:zinc transporter ZupT